jgi:hypothetical protein
MARKNKLTWRGYAALAFFAWLAVLFILAAIPDRDGERQGRSG